MDLRQLAALIAVADGGSFSAAAGRSTPCSRTSRPTSPGSSASSASPSSTAPAASSPRRARPWCARARRVQAELDALDADVAALRDEVTGTVRLGCIGTTARWLVPLVLEAVTATHPKVHVIVVDATTTSLVPRLLADELDLAVVNLPVADPEMSTEPLFDEDRLLIAPDGHPLAERRAGDLRRPGRPRAAARADRHRLPGRARPRGRRPPASSCGPRPRSTASASSPRSPSRGSAPPSCRRRPRPTGSRAAGGGCRWTAWRAARSGWPGARAASCPPRPEPCARP